MSPGKVLRELRDPSDDLPSATLTYAIGRHTGALTHQPVVATLAVATAGTLWAVRRRRRRQAGSGTTIPGDRPDEVGPEREWGGDRWVLGAAVGGLGGYVALYLISFTDNYFGGGQSVGNRYFLQVSALVAVIPVAAAVRERVAIAAGAVGAALGVLLITPHLFQPEEAFYHLERTSPVQRLLPFDGSQAGSWRFECDPDVDCEPPPVVPYED
jgi:4-amino-4-deoxy-L-arabinose transferase-like glycosyltransferase